MLLQVEFKYINNLFKVDLINRTASDTPIGPVV